MSGAFQLRVRVTPGANRTRVGGVWNGPEGDERLVVRVSAAPEKGKANKSALEAVAKAFGLPKSAVSVTAGDKDRLKTFTLIGDLDAMAARLAALKKE
ncbi:MAG: DUF167 domain-containing protein [Parvularculaceae bacterium]|nr:DUF167 domain-containing protein [Parvularculaceae bacterium]